MEGLDLSDTKRTVWHGRVIIVLLSLILIVLVRGQGGELTPEKIGGLGASAAAILYALVDAVKRVEKE